MNKQLSTSTKKSLLKIARDTIHAKLTGKMLDISEECNENLQLQQTGGVFVTLHIDGELRGCIGLIESPCPIIESVQKMANEAAFRDPRFCPLTMFELAEVDLEISVLTTPTEIASPQEIKIGKDGIIFSYLGHRALFLPQVAPEQGWNLETTLSHLAMKAGLSPDSWQKEGSRFKVFQAEHFSESELMDV